MKRAFQRGFRKELHRRKAEIKVGTADWKDIMQKKKIMEESKELEEKL
jgi:hypothetical protein